MTQLSVQRERVVITRAEWDEYQELKAAMRCNCPVGFGTVRSPGCPRHGIRQPKHTITGPTTAQQSEGGRRLPLLQTEAKDGD